MTFDGLASLREMHSLVREDNPAKMDPPGPFTAATAALRADLIAEEVAETVQAFLLGDPIETADGIADSLYVLYGTLEQAGQASAPLVCNGGDGGIMRSKESALGDVIKYARITIIIIRSLPENPERVGELRQYGALLIDALNVYADAWELPIEEVFEDVHSSNMSKRFLEADGKRHFRFHDNGKFQKSPDYRPADVKGILERTGVIAHG